ncbi:TauD/TfdA dioxygenase family protein [Frankia tisae]|uniref:TauD/TfdA dioxygenase family protein n=1 Tax=Frankia tisae TaxID=2950104 RepID=UPI0021BFB899|nr:TauD/TfdA family dioxygenase [Frankia tisae]
MTAIATRLSIRPLNANFGAEITGVDLSRELDAATAAGLREAWLDYQVLFFPGQHLDPSQQERFAAVIGELTAGSAVLNPIDAGSRVVAFDSRTFTNDSGYNLVNDVWHADVTFTPTPPAGAVFNVVTLPSAGGSTAFASAHVGYESLSAPVQQFLEGLVAVHGYAGPRPDGHWEGHDLAPEGVEHPVVAVHPETSRKGLFVNPQLTRSIKGLSAVESDAILKIVYDQTTRLDNVIQYHWREGDAALWDNRAVWHRRVADNHPDSARVVHRVQLRGTRPVGVHGAAPAGVAR